jgi:hypothetical protein
LRCGLSCFVCVSIPVGVREGGAAATKGTIDWTPEFVVMASNIMCGLYSHEGNCHVFFAGSNRLAVLDVIFLPYKEDDGRERRYCER